MKKGITLITLIVMATVIVILATTITITGANAINNSKKMKFASELLFMQEIVDSYITENSGKLPIIGEKFTNSNLPAGEYYKIDNSLFGLVDTTYGRNLKNDPEDIYVLSNNTNIVYYLKGLKIGNEIYYTLDDELKSIINYTDTNIEERDGIIFTPSETDYTNKDINVEVRVPVEYSGVSVFSQNNQITNFSTDQGYNVYNITKASNFEIVVNYTKDSKNLKQIYNVSNYDNEAPTITVKDTTTLSNNENTQTSITISTNDNLSGVAKILYEVNNVEKEYFEAENKGKIVTNNNIVVDKYTKYVTFYVVDKAGNSRILLETLNPTASVDDYVKYGLLVHLDAIDNAGNTSSSTTTVWKDLSGKGNNGIVTNIDGTAISGWNNDSLVLDGVDDYVDLGLANYDLGNSITFSAIVKFNEFTNNAILGNWQNGGCGIGINPNTHTIFTNFCTDPSVGYVYAMSPTVVELGKYYSVVGKYDGREVSLYINGEFVVKNQLTGNIVISTAPVAIGVNPSTQAVNHKNFTKCNIKNAKIYNRALTEEEIKHNYNIDRARFGI